MHRSPHIVFDPAEVIETRREARLATTLDLVFERHPAYRRLAKTGALSRNDLQSIDDLSKLPVTSKTDYMNAPEDFRLEANGLGGGGGAFSGKLLPSQIVTPVPAFILTLHTCASFRVSHRTLTEDFLADLLPGQ